MIQMENQQGSRNWKDPAMERYFASLPSSLQETIMQAGVDFDDLEDLKSCAEQFLDH